MRIRWPSVVRNVILGSVIVVAACSSPSSPESLTQEIASPLFDGMSWFPIGPSPISNGQVYGDSPKAVTVIGRATAIAVNPVNEHEVYLGTANGGLWHST